MLVDGARAPVLERTRLDRSSGEHGVQCCGGEVTLLLEPVRPARPVVAVFGAGHVGPRARPGAVGAAASTSASSTPGPTSSRPSPPAGSGPPTSPRVAAPVPDIVARDLPAGTAVLVMTHDHAEDLAVLDVCLRRDDLGFLGLIGSASKWRTFQGAARRRSVTTRRAVARVTSPVGLPGVPGKSPAAIAVAVAAQLLTVLDLPEASTS